MVFRRDAQVAESLLNGHSAHCTLIDRTDVISEVFLDVNLWAYRLYQKKNYTIWFELLKKVKIA